MSASTNPNTTENIAIASTGAHPLLAGLASDHQFTPLTEKECVARNIGHTSKAKGRLGIAEDHDIVWNHANFSPEDTAILTAFCKGQNIRTSELLARVAMTWFADNKAEITKAADAFIKAEMTAEEALKAIEAGQRKMAALMAQHGLVMNPDGTYAIAKKE